MEKDASRPSGNMSADSNAPTSSVEEAVETVSSSSFATNDSDTSIFSPSVLSNQNPDDEKNTGFSLKMSTLPSDTIKSTLAEASDKSPDTPGIPSGFDSADSTNDEDFLITQKAVLSAIDLMDEGLKDEEESLMDKSAEGKKQTNILTSEDECETRIETSCPKELESELDVLITQKAVLSAIDLMDEGLKDEEESLMDKSTEGKKLTNINSEDECETRIETSCPKELESKLDEDKISNKTPTNCKSDFSISRSENSCEYSRKVDSVVAKESISGAGLEKMGIKKGENNDDAKEITDNDTKIVNDSSKEGETPEPIKDKSNESHRKQQIGIGDKNIKKGIESSNYLANNNITGETKLKIDSSFQNDELKSIEQFPKESTPIDSTSNGKVKNEFLEIEDGTSAETLEIRKICEKTFSEDSSNTHISGSKLCDVVMNLEHYPSISDIKTENKNKLDYSDEVVVLDEIPSSSDIQDLKREVKPALPVSVEISDVEVSVFKYERNKREKIKKAEEFKLDDMVLSSDEDSDGSENIKGGSIDTSKDELNTTSDISDYAGTNSAHKITEEADAYSSEETKNLDATKEPQSTIDRNSEIEVMDVEDNSTIQEECNGKNQEETTKMDLEESDDSSKRKVTFSELNKSECFPNESTNEGLSKSEDMEMASRPKSSDYKDDNETKSNDSVAVPRKDNEIENNSKVLDSNETHFENNKTDLEDMLRTALADNKKFRENLSLESNEGNNKTSSESTVSKDAEVISLVDDDEDDGNKKRKPAAAINCVNPNCMSGEDLAPPAMFVLSYFGLKRSKGQQVCAECFNVVLEHQEVLSLLLKERKPMLSANFPSHKDVILLDSDEESLSDNESNLSDDTMSMIRENLDDVISETLAKVDFDFQLRESCNILNNRLTKLEEEASEITRRYDGVQHSLDEFRKRIYEDFQQETREKEEVHFMECEIPPMPIIKSKLQNQLYNRELMNRLRKSQHEREGREVEEQQAAPTRTIATKKVTYISQPQLSAENATQDVTFVRSEAKCEPPPSLPPPGLLARPKLRVGDLAYTMKVSYFSIWVHCRIIEIIPRNPTENDPSTETYRVKLENVKKNAVRTVTGKYLAYPTPARVQLKVGVRVIAIFKEEDDSAATKDNYYVGVVAEPPKSTNKYRYLVFFDDGYTQYCPHENILVVCATSKNVWEDIHPEPRDFIKNYLQQYPERPMVKLSRGQIVKVEWNGRWWIVRVLEVDGSLVKVHFDADKRTEWIYRGSTRLGPMYQELAAAKERQHGSLLRTRGFGGGAHHKSDMPYVEYTRGDGEGDNENKPEEKEKSEEPVEEQAPAPRSVARKSTAKKPAEPVISNTPYCKPLINHPPEGSLRQRSLRPKCRPIHFRPHQCSEACVAWTGHTPAAAKKYDPLVKPLIFGFERLLGSFKGKTIVQYRAPCGRMIRTQQEMLCYLRGTRSQLTIDLFDFDFWVNPLNEFEEGSTFGKIEDLSYGKENVRISCVNELDHSMPQYVQYMTARQPAKDVNLNLDQEFLVGCDCTDDCEDRSKCSCWQLTLQGKAYVPDGDLDPLFGYQYRRLPERIATGIYECNSRCKCSMTCQNRVAQQPLSCRLQLFKTLKKGWGIRCLHDIPRGAFICIYAGFLLTEQEANEGGKTYGDEYLAELDYIESVENLKEGYESEARDMSDLEDDDDISQKDTMDIEYEHSADSDVEVEQGYSRRPGDIRLRLRRRTAEEAEKESRKSRTDDDAISISDDELDSGLCGGCRESLDNVKDILRCQGCMKSYHCTCTPLKTSANVEKLGSNKSSWICPKCEALVRKPKTFDANITVNDGEDADSRYPSVRELYGPEENVYIMDAKTHGNIGRYLNHSCSPNVFVQNVFVDTHDLRFPWVAFFANQYIPAGVELTWDYNYDVGSVPGKVMLCYCGSSHCRGRLL